MLASRLNHVPIVWLAKKGEGGLCGGEVSIKTGRMQYRPHKKDSGTHQRFINYIGSNERRFGDIRLFTKENTKETLAGTMAWTDVYVTSKGSNERNLSQSDGAACSQPALSHDQSRVAFVKAGGE